MYKFDLNAKGYSKQNAYALMQLSDLAYEDWYIVRECLKYWGFDNMKRYDKGDTQAFIVWNELYAVVAFRGTSSIEDAKTDAKIRKIQKPYGRVHRGFDGGLDYIWRDVARDLHMNRTLPLFFTGHSLGGALAANAKRRLECLEGRKSTCYTFGEPRGGDREYAEYGDTSNHFRNVNNNDVVTDIPKLNYFHGGQLIYYNESREIAEDTFLSRLEGKFDDVGEAGLDCVKDHFRTEYLMCTMVAP